MPVIKIKNKKALEQLQARLALKIGRKLTQQETLDYCVMFATQHFDQLVETMTQMPALTLEKANQLIAERNKLQTIPYDPSRTFANPEDNEIYKD